MPKNQISGIVQQGVFSNMKAVAAMCEKHEGKEVTITVQGHRKQRSNPQNRYYWGVVIPYVINMFQENGTPTDGDNVNHYLKRHVGNLMEPIITPDGDRVLFVRSSADLSVQEFEDYMTIVRAWSAELGEVIPLPNEDKYKEWINEQLKKERRLS